MVSEPVASGDTTPANARSGPSRQAGAQAAGGISDEMAAQVGSSPGSGPGSSPERARAILRELIVLSGMSQREVKRRLVEQGLETDLFRVLSGRLELKLRHIVEICCVLEIHLPEFFSIAFAAPASPSAFMRRLQALIRLQTSAAPADGATPALADRWEEIEGIERQLRGLSGEVERLKAQARGGGVPGPASSGRDRQCARRR